MSEEQVSKKAKIEEPTGWEDHTLNISEAVMKVDEGKHFSDLATMDVSSIQGIGPRSSEVLDALGIKTIKELATYKFFLMARSLKTLSETETKDGRLNGALMNVDKAVDKAWEPKSLTEICEAPVEALQGLTDKANELLASLGVKSIGDLAELKYCRWAEAIVDIAPFEESMTLKERKVDTMLKQLA